MRNKVSLFLSVYIYIIYRSIITVSLIYFVCVYNNNKDIYDVDIGTKKRHDVHTYLWVYIYTYFGAI